MITGGELVIRTLRRHGVTQAFGLHGAHLEAMFQSCVDHGVPVLDVRHEVAAGHAAEGYARTTNRLGVAMITAGGGFTNGLTSIANAYVDRTPVLYLVGGPPLMDVEANALQGGFDQVAMARPVTKWAQQVTSPVLIPRLVAQAIRIATSGPTGPVMLELPMDVSLARIDESEVAIPGYVGLEAVAAPVPKLITEALTLLQSAARPIILAGTEAHRSGAAVELTQFARQLGIPVFTDYEAHGLIPADDPLYGGTSYRLADYKTQRPDVVMLLGARFGLFTFGVHDAIIPKAAKVIHVNTDARELMRLRDTEVSILADSRAALGALLDTSRSMKFPDFSEWRAVVSQTRKARTARLDAAAGHASPIHPYRAIATVLACLEPDTTVVADGAETYSWVNELVAQQLPGSYLTHGYYGTMGCGLGLALGAKVGRPTRPLVLFVGDGAVGFTIAEFDTMVRHQLPIVVVVINNKSWAACQRLQEAMSGRVASTRLGDAAYEQVAEGFGCFGAKVTELSQLAPAVRAAFASGRPACINVLVDYTPIAPETELLMQVSFG